MEKIFEERTEVVKVETGMQFSYKERYSDFFAQLSVDKNGNPTHADYGSYDGWCSKDLGESGFDAAVTNVMKILLERDVEEFKNMRDFLSPTYRQMAEDLRKDKLSKYNF